MNWISVKEKNPPSNMLLILGCDYPQTSCCGFCEDGRYFKHAYIPAAASYVFCETDFMLIELFGITHWSYFPSGPK